MAGTPYSDVYDFFMLEIRDWKLNELYQSDPTAFALYLQGYLVLSIQDFKDDCDQSLARDDNNAVFDEILTEENQKVLATIMSKYWMKQKTQDVLNMNLHVQDKDFKVYAEANNLNAKSSHYNSLKEEISQILYDYNFKRVNWSNWKSGIFGS